jgi:hypothetical protein
MFRTFVSGGKISRGWKTDVVRNHFDSYTALHTLHMYISVQNEYVILFSDECVANIALQSSSHILHIQIASDCERNPDAPSSMEEKKTIQNRIHTSTSSSQNILAST